MGLHTWRVSGPGLSALEEVLKEQDAVEQIARFGAVLHVSGTDAKALEAVIGEVRAHHPENRWEEKPAELEEAFIYLMATAADNFALEAM